MVYFYHQNKYLQLFSNCLLMIFCHIAHELKHFWISSSVENENPISEIFYQKIWIKLHVYTIIEHSYFCFETYSQWYVSILYWCWNSFQYPSFLKVDEVQFLRLQQVNFPWRIKRNFHNLYRKYNNNTNDATLLSNHRWP